MYSHGFSHFSRLPHEIYPHPQHFTHTHSRCVKRRPGSSARRITRHSSVPPPPWTPRCLRQCPEAPTGWWAFKKGRSCLNVCAIYTFCDISENLEMCICVSYAWTPKVRRFGDKSTSNTHFPAPEKRTCARATTLNPAHPNLFTANSRWTLYPIPTPNTRMISAYSWRAGPVFLCPAAPMATLMAG